MIKTHKMVKKQQAFCNGKVNACIPVYVCSLCKLSCAAFFCCCYCCYLALVSLRAKFGAMQSGMVDRPIRSSIFSSFFFLLLLLENFWSNINTQKKRKPPPQVEMIIIERPIKRAVKRKKEKNQAKNHSFSSSFVWWWWCTPLFFPHITQTTTWPSEKNKREKKPSKAAKRFESVKYNIFFTWPYKKKFGQVSKILRRFLFSLYFL